MREINYNIVPYHGIRPHIRLFILDAGGMLIHYTRIPITPTGETL